MPQSCTTSLAISSAVCTRHLATVCSRLRCFSDPVDLIKAVLGCGAWASIGNEILLLRKYSSTNHSTAPDSVSDLPTTRPALQHVPAFIFIILTHGLLFNNIDCKAITKITPVNHPYKRLPCYQAANNGLSAPRSKDVLIHPIYVPRVKHFHLLVCFIYFHISLGFCLTLYPAAVTKKTEEGGNAKFAYAVSEMQGWRISESFVTSLAHRSHSDDIQAAMLVHNIRDIVLTLSLVQLWKIHML